MVAAVLVALMYVVDVTVSRRYPPPHRHPAICVCRDLELSSNSFSASSLPATISVMTQLQVLQMASAQLTGALPSWITTMTRLSYVPVPRACALCSPCLTVGCSAA